MRLHMDYRYFRVVAAFLVLAVLAACVAVLTGTPAMAQNDKPNRPTGFGVTVSTTTDNATLTFKWNDPNDSTITHYEILRRHKTFDRVGEFHLFELVDPDDLTAQGGKFTVTRTLKRAKDHGKSIFRIRARNEHGASSTTSYRNGQITISSPAGYVQPLKDESLTKPPAPEFDAIQAWGIKPYKGQCWETTITGPRGQIIIINRQHALLTRVTNHGVWKDGRYSNWYGVIEYQVKYRGTQPFGSYRDWNTRNFTVSDAVNPLRPIRNTAGSSLSEPDFRQLDGQKPFRRHFDWANGAMHCGWKFEFQMRARNQHGWSDWSERVK